MVDLARLFSSEGKGSSSTYRPTAGTRCLISGPNMDDDNGYVFLEQTILWSDEIFLVYRTDSCWPVVQKWEHVIAKPLAAVPCVFRTGCQRGQACIDAGLCAHGAEMLNRIQSTQETVVKCPECKGARQVCVGTSGLECDGNAPILERCEACDGTGTL